MASMYGNSGALYQNAQQQYGAAGQMPSGIPMPVKQMMGRRVAMPPQMSAPLRLSFCSLLASVMVPWFIFACVFYVRGMWLRFAFPWLSIGLSAWFLLMVMVSGVMAASAARDSKQGDPRMLGLVFVLSVTAWITATAAGDSVFIKYTQAYYDLTNLNSYPSVNPVKYNGAQLMDAGIIDFQKGAKLDLTKTIGFKDNDIYCVAPVTIEGASTDTKSFDFWAVGTNCCSGHSSQDFKCGEYNHASVHKGLRLMDDSQRSFYRLAVKEAEAAYNIVAKQPIFLHWLSDPTAEVEAYQDDAYWYFLFGIFAFFSVVLFSVIVALVCFYTCGDCSSFGVQAGGRFYGAQP